MCARMVAHFNLWEYLEFLLLTLNYVDIITAFPLYKKKPPARFMNVWILDIFGIFSGPFL